MESRALTAGSEKPGQRGQRGVRAGSRVGGAGVWEPSASNVRCSHAPGPGSVVGTLRSRAFRSGALLHSSLQSVWFGSSTGSSSGQRDRFSTGNQGQPRQEAPGKGRRELPTRGRPPPHSCCSSEATALCRLPATWKGVVEPLTHARAAEGGWGAQRGFPSTPKPCLVHPNSHTPKAQRDF